MWIPWGKHLSQSITRNQKNRVSLKDSSFGGGRRARRALLGGGPEGVRPRLADGGNPVRRGPALRGRRKECRALDVKPRVAVAMPQGLRQGGPQDGRVHRL